MGPGLGSLLWSASLHLSPKPISSWMSPGLHPQTFFFLSPDSLFSPPSFLIKNPLLAMNPRFLSTSQSPAFNT